MPASIPARRSASSATSRRPSPKGSAAPSPTCARRAWSPPEPRQPGGRGPPPPALRDRAGGGRGGDRRTPRWRDQLGGATVAIGLLLAGSDDVGPPLFSGGNWAPPAPPPPVGSGFN